MNYVLRIFAIIVSIFASMNLLVAQWAQTNGPEGVYTTYLVSDETYLYVGTFFADGIYRSNDNGINWTKANSGLTNKYVLTLISNGNNIFAGTFGGIFRSTNHGDTWITSDSGITCDTILTLASFGDSLFAGTAGKGVFFSSDHGDSWNQFNIGLTNYIVRKLFVYDTLVFAGTFGGIFYSSYCSNGWESAGLIDKEVKTFILKDTLLFAGVPEYGIFRSTNMGIVWAPADSGVTHTDIHSFITVGYNILAGTDGDGIFSSTNNGDLWFPINQGLTNNRIRSFIINGTNVFVATWGAGVWQRPIAELVSSIDFDQPLNIGSFRLEQNYPNPFNPSTTIRYQLPTQNHVTLEVFDVLGREITRLVNRVEEPGYKSVNFDASRLPSGVYYYRLQAGSYIGTKKLLLLRWGGNCT